MTLGISPGLGATCSTATGTPTTSPTAATMSSTLTDRPAPTSSGPPWPDRPAAATPATPADHSGDGGQGHDPVEPGLYRPVACRRVAQVADDGVDAGVRDLARHLVRYRHPRAGRPQRGHDGTPHEAGAAGDQYPFAVHGPI